MTKLVLLYFLFALSVNSCNQKSSQQKPGNKITYVKVKNNTHEQANDTSDTTKFCILPLDTSYIEFKNLKETVLSDQDVKLTEKMLIKCVENNNNQDTSKHILRYIDLSNYKRQYMPFLNKRGEKLVWVNCFCISDMNFPDWKKEIVIVDDGGSC